VHVSAKDLGTGKEQSIKITASSGLSEEEIDKLVKDAEAHEDEDKKKKELIELRNQADSLIYGTEKNLKDMGDQIDADQKSRIEDSIAKLKTAMEGDDADVIKAAQEEATQASHKLAEAMYAKATAKETEADAAGASEGAQAESAKADDDVVDADFEEVKKE